MTPDDLITLAKRKNEAHKELLKIRAQMRVPAGQKSPMGGAMTEKDRDIDMDFRTREARETYENLCDEWAIQMKAYTDQNADYADRYRGLID